MVTYKVMIDFQTTLNKKNISGTSGKEFSQPFTNMSKEATKAANSVSTKVGPSLQQVNAAFDTLRKVAVFRGMGIDVNKFSEELSSANQVLGSAGGNIKFMAQKAVKMSKGFDMSALSITFFGMAIQRFFGGMQTQMLNTFKLIDKKGVMPLTRGLNKMQAAFQFLSFRIMDAMGPMLLAWINGLVGVVDWIAGLDKGWLNLLGTLISVGAALGAIGVLFGTLKLGLGGMGMGASIDKLFGVGTASGLTSLAGGAIMLTVGLSLLPSAVELIKGGIEDIQKALETGDFQEAMEGVGKILGGSLIGGISLILVGAGIVQIATGLTTLFGGTAVTGAATAGGLAIGGVLTSAIAAGIILAGAVVVAALTGLFILAMINAMDKVENGGGFEYSPDLLVQKKMWEDAGFEASLSYDKGLEVGMKDNSINELIAGSFNRSPEQEAEFQKNLANWKAGGQEVVDSIVAGVKEKESDVTNAYATSLEQPLSTAIINITDVSGVGGAQMMTNFADQVTATTPYLIDSISIAFTEATKVMESIVSASVDRVIADVNRALSALRSLESKKASVSSSSTTNNNQKVNVNVSGGNPSSVATAVKRAVMV
jgi:hypothetical protein